MISDLEQKKATVALFASKKQKEKHLIRHISETFVIEDSITMHILHILEILEALLPYGMAIYLLALCLAKAPTRSPLILHATYLVQHGL
jgi:hypothetical protein